MTEARPQPGWYRADGDPIDTHRYWDGHAWIGDAQSLPPDMARPGSGDLASPWRRVLARLIDVGVVIAASLLVRALVDDDLSSAQPTAAAAIITLMLTVAYEVGMVSGLGATVGKLITGLRVIDNHGQCPPNAVVAIRRWSPNVLALVPFIGIFAAMAVLLASLIWIFTDARRRSIFDKAADTTVIAVGRRGS